MPSKHAPATPSLQQLSGQLRQISDQIADAAAMLRRCSDTAGDRSEVHAEWVRQLIRLRRLRAKHFDQELLADPAWDILLNLYAEQLEGRRTTVSSVATAAAVPPTTALRWIQKLTDRSLLVRVSESSDRRRVYIELSADAYASLEAYLGEAGAGQFIV